MGKWRRGRTRGPQRPCLTPWITFTEPCRIPWRRKNPPSLLGHCLVGSECQGVCVVVGTLLLHIHRAFGDFLRSRVVHSYASENMLQSVFTPRNVHKLWCLHGSAHLLAPFSLISVVSFIIVVKGRTLSACSASFLLWAAWMLWPDVYFRLMWKVSPCEETLSRCWRAAEFSFSSNFYFAPVKNVYLVRVERINLCGMSCRCRSALPFL